MTNCFRAISLVLICLALAAGSCHVAARADFIGNLVTIEAVNADGRGTWQMAVPQNPPDTIDYMNPDPILLLDAEQMVIGTIDDLTLHLEGDPEVNISFVATAGNFPTTFTVSSAVVNFPAIPNPTANASANVTLTDTSTNGALYNPVSPSTGTFLPTYNGSTVFAELIGSQTVSMGGSVNQSTATGDQPIAGSVSSIQGRFQFTLSANDVANGMGHFEVVPEPSTLCLIGTGTLILAGVVRRRFRQQRPPA